ncbi:glycosyltransferase family 2 protein [Lutibacter sp. A64]|uniref:glycosyltransferase family 2 protein n=1 Tax=Lutibacter sp. A64 TaxID=2918526 RepID=UPI001F051E5F|nr:glycosyltransferase family 2 protein [Lutibacter sp. A64]UMB55461.1 glycosyltransferase family 2 protein [Lutibacter sp. A64]
MKLVTVFTPTYNRAFCLGQLYESLLKQTATNFCWLIIDDGSTDTTKELVATWIAEHKIEINYVFQENQGMHGAHNTAYSLITTELNVCVDSDDYMPNNAIELILNTWESVKHKNTIAGIVGLDCDTKNNSIGTKFPESVKETTLYDLYHKHGVLGDKKLVYKTEIVKKYPKYPIFSGENFVPLGYLYQLIDQDYKLITLNEVLCIVDYRQDGSSATIIKQYRLNPKGFAFSRKSRMLLATSFKDKFKNAIHYVSSSLFIKNKNFLKESPKKGSTVLAIPFGILLYYYIKFKTRAK